MDKQVNIKVSAWFCLIIILAIFGITVYLDYKQDNDAIVERKDLEVKLQAELNAKTFCLSKADSLKRVNFELSKFKALTTAMIHREEATKQLKYKIGDIVWLKIDSSRVIIEDIIIGGGKYNYYMKYKVLFVDNTSKDIIPELIY